MLQQVSHGVDRVGCRWTHVPGNGRGVVVMTDQEGQPGGFDQGGAPPAEGLIDIHSHLLPEIDDGCESVEQSIESIRALQGAGFTGSICTPHVWPDQFVYNDAESIRIGVEHLRMRLKEAGVDYPLWAGGELRLYDGVTDWLNNNEPPTLAGSRCLLVDFWTDKWPKWVVRVFEWMLNNNLQPILAHPERLGCTRGLEKRLAELSAMGVWLQGNFRSMTGEEGYSANQLIRGLLRDGRYKFLATDAHRPESLYGRLDGLGLIEAEFGAHAIDRLTADAPRRHIFAHLPRPGERG